MIKCGVCGSENEAEALFCGTCGSPLSQKEAREIADEATKPHAVEPVDPDEAVVPGKGGSTRVLGTGGAGTGGTPPPDGGAPGGGTEPVVVEPEPEAGAATVTCRVCGTVNEATRTYCRKCANELKPQTAAPPPPPPPPPGGGIPKVVLGLGGAAILVAAVIIGVLVLNGGNPGASPTAGAAATAEATTGPSEPAVTDAPVTASPPIFTEGDPEGRIVFSRCEGSERCRLILIEADGTPIGRQTDPAAGSATDPAFSNDGTRIAYTLPNGIRILTVEGGAITRHSSGNGDRNVSWSPDDSEMLFAASGRAGRDEPPIGDLEIRLDGVTETRDSEPLTVNAIEDHDPVWADGGASVIWAEGSGDARRLMRMDLGTRTATELPTPDLLADVDPAVSPANQDMLVFAARPGAGAGYDLFLMDLSTMEVTPLPSFEGDEHDPAWSPGGRYIVYSGGAADDTDIFRIDLANLAADPVQLTATPHRDLAPSWSR